MKKTKDITPIEYKVIAPLIMGNGIGDGKNTASLVAQAATIDALRKGLTLDEPTDKLECACPLLRRMAVSANCAGWWKDDAERTEYLRPLIPMLLDSRGSLELAQRRAARYCNAVIHELTPLRLEWIVSHTKSKEFAAECRNGIKAIAGIKPITDKATAIKALDVLRGLYSYAYASVDAYAYVDAYDSIYDDASVAAGAYSDVCDAAHKATDAYAYFDSYAYGSAAGDFDTDTYPYEAAYAGAQKLKYRDLFLSLFRELAAMTE